MVVAPKPGHLDKIQALVDRARLQDKVAPANAAVLRGQLVFLGTQLQGRALRFCQWAEGSGSQRRIFVNFRPNWPIE